MTVSSRAAAAVIAEAPAAGRRRDQHVGMPDGLHVIVAPHRCGVACDVWALGDELAMAAPDVTPRSRR